MNLKGKLAWSCPISDSRLYLIGLERESITASNDYATAARLLIFPESGFGGLTKRLGKKPIIAAVNGHAHGGGKPSFRANSSLTMRSPIRLCRHTKTMV